jgi:hypothetical protein
MTPTEDEHITHPLDVGYLVVGLVLLGISGLWALRAADLVDTGQLGWLVPLLLIAAGTVGLGGFAARGLRRHRRADSRLDDTLRYDDLSSTDPGGDPR